MSFINWVGLIELSELSELDGKKINLFVSGAFFPSLSKEYYLKIDKSTSNKLYKLNANQDSIEKYIYKNGSAGDTIVIANHLQLLFSKEINDSDEALNIKNKYLDIYFGRLENFTKKLSKKDINVIYVEPYPFFKNFDKIRA